MRTNGFCQTIVLLALVFVISPLFGVTAHSAPKGKGELAAKSFQLKERDRIVAAVPANWPPQYSLDIHGNPTGFAIDVLDHLADQLGMSVDYVVTDTFGGSIQLLADGKVDLIPNSGIIEQRLTTNLFTPPVETFQVVVFARAGSLSITSIDAIQGKNVGVVKANAGRFLLENRKDLKLTLFDTPDQLLVGLLAGSIDAAIYPDSVFLSIARQIGVDDKIKIVGAPLKEIRRGLQFRKDSSDLHALFSSAVSSFIFSPEYNQVYSKWYGKPTPFWTARRVLHAMAILMAVMAALLIAWRYYTVSKLNRKLKASHGELKELNATLEQRVDTRTRELTHEMEERRRSQRDLETFFSQAQSLNLIIDFDGTIQLINPAWEHVLGYSEAEIKSRPFIEFVAPEDRDKAQADYEALVAGHPIDGSETRWICKSGEQKYLRISARANAENRLVYAAAQNITVEKYAEASLKLAASVFTAADEGIVITDASGKIIEVNETFCDITGYSRTEVQGQSVNILQSGHQSADFYEEMWNSLKENGVWRGEIWNRKKNGTVYPELLTISAFEDDQGKTTNYVGLFSDITSLKTHERELEQLARFDRLTGLPNRVLLSEQLNKAMAHALRQEEKVAIVFIDLDGFKAVNDTHGHSAGDLLLIEAGKRLKSVLRTEDTLARIGGDEFVAIITGLQDEKQYMNVLERLLTTVSKDFYLGEASVSITASIGITFFPQSEDIDGEQLERQADQAMYQAKLAGRNCYRFFDPEQHREMAAFYALMAEAQNAIKNDEFRLHYQPKIDLHTGLVIGCEALLRWQHPTRGFLYPGDFLPPIENDPSIALPLGNWVLDHALKQMDEWRMQGLEMPVSVNASALQIMAPDFEDVLKEHLSNHPDTPSGALEIELLETDALQDLEHVSGVIENCRKLGVHFALDDFGTGYSSLVYLKQLPIQTLKIDQGFVSECLAKKQDQEILQTIISLGRIFNLDILAEGVETDAHGRLLRDLGCRYAQGYAIAKPMAPAEFPDWYRSWASKTASDWTLPRHLETAAS